MEMYSWKCKPRLLNEAVQADAFSPANFERDLPKLERFMRRRTGMMTILIVSFSGVLLAFNHSDNKEVQTDKPDKTKDNIRLVLVGISRGSLFSQKPSDENNKASYQMIPKIKMECLVEYLGEGEIRSHSISSNPEFTKDGKPAFTDSIRKDGHSWSHNGLKVIPYDQYDMLPLHKPNVGDPDKAKFYRMQMLGSRLKSDVVDFKIRVKINNETEVFNFKNVPVL